MGQYTLVIERDAQKELQAHYRAGDKGLIKKIEKILEELKIHPETGEGKPEPLKYQLSGLWSRRINQEHRIIYEITENSVHIHSAKGHYV